MADEKAASLPCLTAVSHSCLINLPLSTGGVVVQPRQYHQQNHKYRNAPNQRPFPHRFQTPPALYQLFRHEFIKPSFPSPPSTKTCWPPLSNHTTLPTRCSHRTTVGRDRSLSGDSSVAGNLETRCLEDWKATRRGWVDATAGWEDGGGVCSSDGWHGWEEGGIRNVGVSGVGGRWWWKFREPACHQRYRRA